MKLEKVLKVVTIYLVMVMLMFVIKLAGGALRTGVDAACASIGNANNVTVTNFFEIAMTNICGIHTFVEAGFAIGFVWFFYDFLLNRFRFDAMGAKLFMIFAVSMALLMISFMSYLLQFIVKAVWLGLTSSAGNVVIDNIISWTRALDIEPMTTLCEGYVVVIFFYMFKKPILRYRRKVRMEEENASRAEEAARKAREDICRAEFERRCNNGF